MREKKHRREAGRNQTRGRTTSVCEATHVHPPTSLAMKERPSCTRACSSVSAAPISISSLQQGGMRVVVVLLRVDRLHDAQRSEDVGNMTAHL